MSIGQSTPLNHLLSVNAVTPIGGISSLPLPQHEGIHRHEHFCPHPPLINAIYFSVGDKEEREDSGEIETTPHLDSFDEVYKTYELTDFDRLLSRSIAKDGRVSRTVQYYVQPQALNHC